MALDKSVNPASMNASMRTEAETLPTTLSFSEKFSAFKEFSKTNVMMLVLMMTFLGYLMGQPLNQLVDLSHLSLTLLGTWLLGAGSTSLNQLQERHIDRKMNRTQNRPLPSQRLHLTEAWLFIGLTLMTGAIVLWEINPIVFTLGLLTVVTYNLGYTLWWKRAWAFGAIPGALPGALPILMGYAAISPAPFSNEALFIFLLLFFWQMPHFWSLAIRFKDDYRQGGIPTLPVTYGVERTVQQIVLWTLGYIGLAIMGHLFLKASSVYLFIVVPTSLKVLWELFEYAKDTSKKRWLRFFLWVNFSLLLYLAAAVVDRWKPIVWDLIWV